MARVVELLLLVILGSCVGAAPAEPCDTDIPHSNFANVNITYDDGEVDVTCDAGYHVSGQEPSSVSYVTRCQLDGTLSYTQDCESKYCYSEWAEGIFLSCEIF